MSSATSQTDPVDIDELMHLAFDTSSTKKLSANDIDLEELFELLYPADDPGSDTPAP